MKVSVVLALGLVGSASAFVAQSLSKKASSLTTTSLGALNRRHFFEAGASALLIGSFPAVALEDLAEPTPEEKEAAEVRFKIR